MIMTTDMATSYSGTNIVANVAYDTFLGTSATGAQAYEVMVWLGDFGGASPLSNNGYPATPYSNTSVGGTQFGLDIGANGNTVVYSFVATSKAATTFRFADIIPSCRPLLIAAHLAGISSSSTSTSRPTIISHQIYIYRASKRAARSLLAVMQS